MAILNVIDSILSVIESTDKVSRAILSVVFAVLGCIVNALTSRTAVRVYASIVAGFICLCQWAIESGRIVRQGYDSVDVAEVVPSVEVPASPQRLLSGSEPQLLLCGAKIPLLLAPAVESAPAVDVVRPIGFIESLMAIAEEVAVTPKFDHLSIVQLRSLGSLHKIKGASRWTKKQAIAALSNA